MDLDGIRDHMAEITMSNFASGKTLLGSTRTNLLRIEQEAIDYDSYTLLTDYEGEVFTAAVAAYMKQNLPAELVHKVKDRYDEMKGVTEQNSYQHNSVGNALDSVKDPEKYIQESGIEVTDEMREKVKVDPKDLPNVSKEEVQGTLENVGKIQADGILSMVLPAGTQISGKGFSGNDRVSLRYRELGKNPQKPTIGFADKAILEQYIVEYLSNFVDQQEGHAMDYELEYILAGKENDPENLKNVVERILATREAANFAYLFTDSAKQSEALAMAVLLAGPTANPVVIEAIKLGLITSWAFCESILDMRTLLSGERIPFAKSTATWTSSLANISQLLSGYTKAISSPMGLSYTDYLGTMIMLEPLETIAYRTMDVQEYTVRQSTGYANFRMDHVTCNMELTIQYQHDSVFLNMVSLIARITEPYKIQKKTSYTYFKF